MDIISYDYSGYGESQGKPTENVIYNDIEEVVNFIRKGLHIKLSNVVLFGNSLGSAVSVHIATKRKYKNIKGVILLSPIASGIKSVSQSVQISRDDLETLDVFSNISKIREVTCPVFIIHGEKDQVIPIEQVKEMSKQIGRLYEWYPKDGDHNNIMYLFRNKFYNRCRMFFDYLKIFFNKHKNDEFDEGSLFLNKERSELDSPRNVSFQNSKKKTEKKIKIIRESDTSFINSKIEENQGSTKEVSEMRDFQQLFGDNEKHSGMNFFHKIEELEEEFLRFQSNLN
jgi:predicted alpha/beta hydrolase family esterase